MLKNFYALGEDDREKPEDPDFDMITPVIEQLKPDSQHEEISEERFSSGTPPISPPK